MHCIEIDNFWCKCHLQGIVTGQRRLERKQLSHDRYTPEIFLVSFPDQIFRRLGRATREKFGLGTRLGMLVFVVCKSAQHSSVKHS